MVTTDVSSPAEYVRRGILKIDPATVLDAVDSLDLRGNAKISPVVGIPLRGLQQRRDVAQFAATAPLAAVRALLELLSMDPLDQVIERLGDHAETPTYDQLTEAVDQMQGAGSSDDEIVALLTFAIGEEFPASPHCQRLLNERPAFALPPLPHVETSTSLLNPKEVSDEVREQRRARREEEKKRKKGAPAARPARPTKAKKDPKAPTSPAAGPNSSPGPLVAVRRRLILTPAEQDRFDQGHPLVGTVVLADVPFDSVDATAPEQREKQRPALVVAASESGILVRPIYSSPFTTRVLFQPWRRLNLDHVSYIDDHRMALDSVGTDGLERLGRLTDDEWNALS